MLNVDVDGGGGGGGDIVSRFICVRRRWGQTRRTRIRTRMEIEAIMSEANARLVAP